jgi:hypothetical protein
MGTMGLPTPAPVSDKSTLRTSVGNMLVLGSSFVGGGSIVLAVVELVRSEPERAFRLLQTWGPWAILALLASWFIYQLTGQALELAGRVGGRIADAMESQAISIKAQAVATQQLADKDDRQVQEMQALTALTAQRSEKTFTMLQSYHEDNQLIAKMQQETLARIEQKVDANIAAGEKSAT